MMAKKKKHNGPYPKVTPDLKEKIYAILHTGGTLKDACGYLELDYHTVWLARKKDTRFDKGVKKGIQTCKMKLIQRVGKASAWAAAAWLLERKWGSEYGRRDKHEITGKGGGPLEVKNAFDWEAYRLAREAAGTGGRISAAENRN